VGRVAHRRSSGAKCRCQGWLVGYIADFYCVEAGLIVEAEAVGMPKASYDDRRTALLEQEGFRVIRFWNIEVMGNLEDVLSVVSAAFVPRPPSGRRTSPSPLRGEGI
jgi:very-short-patch-repair endonuclease